MTSRSHRINCKQVLSLLGGAASRHHHGGLFLLIITLLVWQFASVAFAQTTIRDRDSIVPSKSDRSGIGTNGTSARAVVTASGPSAGATAQDADLGRDWVRLQYGDDGKLLAMQTAIVRYVSKRAVASPARPAVAVDLIGAVHVADVAYYHELNERFKNYDALLYELVAPEGTVVQRGRGTSNANPIGAMQNGIKTLLELDHQLEEIDYTRPNFVHADMSPDQFLQAMKDRNEGFLQMYFRLLGHAMAHQSELSAKGQSLDFELFSALFAKDRPRRLKMALAKQLAEMESLLVSFGGEDGSVIITERNKMALKVLNEQLAAGKQRLGIFYGAGHLNDMDQRLRKEFGLEPESITWLTAWNLDAKR